MASVPPPPSSAPPPPSSLGPSKPSATPVRGALLTDITSFKKGGLKKTKTLDKSTPIKEAPRSGGGNPNHGPSNSSHPPSCAGFNPFANGMPVLKKTGNAVSGAKKFNANDQRAAPNIHPVTKPRSLSTEAPPKLALHQTKDGKKKDDKKKRKDDKKKDDKKSKNTKKVKEDQHSKPEQKKEKKKEHHDKHVQRKDDAARALPKQQKPEQLELPQTRLRSVSVGNKTEDKSVHPAHFPQVQLKHHSPTKDEEKKNISHHALTKDEHDTAEIRLHLPKTTMQKLFEDAPSSSPVTSSSASSHKKDESEEKEVRKSIPEDFHEIKHHHHDHPSTDSAKSMEHQKIQPSSSAAETKAELSSSTEKKSLKELMKEKFPSMPVKPVLKEEHPIGSNLSKEESKSPAHDIAKANCNKEAPKPVAPSSSDNKKIASSTAASSTTENKAIQQLVADLSPLLSVEESKPKISTMQKLMQESSSSTSAPAAASAPSSTKEESAKPMTTMARLLQTSGVSDSPKSTDSSSAKPVSKPMSSEVYKTTTTPNSSGADAPREPSRSSSDIGGKTTTPDASTVSVIQSRYDAKLANLKKLINDSLDKESTNFDALSATEVLLSLDKQVKELAADSQFWAREKLETDAAKFAAEFKSLSASARKSDQAAYTRSRSNALSYVDCMVSCTH